MPPPVPPTQAPYPPPSSQSKVPYLTYLTSAEDLLRYCAIDRFTASASAAATLPKGWKHASKQAAPRSSRRLYHAPYGVSWAGFFLVIYLS